MATELLPCGPTIGQVTAQNLTYQYLREKSALISMLRVRRVNHCGNHLANIMLPIGELKKSCGPDNYPSPDCLKYEMRNVETCSYRAEIKIPGCHVINSSFDMDQFEVNLMHSLAHQGILAFERIVYDALSGDAVISVQETTGGSTVVKSLVDDIGASSVIDASATGLTLDKLYEAVGALASKYGGGLDPILLVPSSAWLELQKDIDTRGGGGPNTCCAYDRGIAMKMTGRYGDITIIRSSAEKKLFKDVGGKLRAFLFQPEAIDIILTTVSSLTRGACKDDMIIRADPDNGYISGIVKVNPGMQFGGLLVQAEINAGGVRIDPDGIVAIDVKK